MAKWGIQVSDQGRVKRKTELVELAQKAFKMKLVKIEEGEDLPKVIDQKPETGRIFFQFGNSFVCELSLQEFFSRLYAAQFLFSLAGF